MMVIHGVYSNNLTDWLSLLYIRGYVAIFPLIYQVGILLDVGNLYEACPANGLLCSNRPQQQSVTTY